jgi:acetylornithine deacetylase/succinyl-diaminopimelate desuccinylase-like protein
MARAIRIISFIELSFFLALSGWIFSAQKINPHTLREKVRHFREQHERAILGEYFDFLSLPNVASDQANIQKNADFILSMLQRRGIKAELLKAGDSPPVVYGELLSPAATHTIVFYAHYDGQPVDAAQWASPPWKPILRDKTLENEGKEILWASLPEQPNGEWRIYARSASDDKAPIMTMMAALDALKESRISLPANLKFFFEGEEEAGSEHLEDIVRKYKNFIRSDVWILCDGPVHQTGRLLIYFGARGVCGLEITLYGPLRPLHSGHYGNWAPNPAVLQSHLLASMRDVNGRILIKGFYDDVIPLSEKEMEALKEAPDIDEDLRKELGLGWSEGKGKSLVEQIMLPALNIRGIQAGNVGEKAQNAIPTEAKASIDFRLVPNETPLGVKRLVEDHIRDQGYFIVYDTPDKETRLRHPLIAKLDWESGYPAARTSMDLPVSQALVRAIEEGMGSRLVKLPSSGGSIPMYLFKDILEAPSVILPVVNYDNNQHGANENVRIQNLWDAIEIFALLFGYSSYLW